MPDETVGQLKWDDLIQAYMEAYNAGLLPRTIICSPYLYQVLTDQFTPYTGDVYTVPKKILFIDRGDEVFVQRIKLAEGEFVTEMPNLKLPCKGKVVKCLGQETVANVIEGYQVVHHDYYEVLIQHNVLRHGKLVPAERFYIVIFEDLELLTKTTKHDIDYTIGQPLNPKKEAAGIVEVERTLIADKIVEPKKERVFFNPLEHGDWIE